MLGNQKIRHQLQQKYLKVDILTTHIMGHVYQLYHFLPKIKQINTFAKLNNNTPIVMITAMKILCFPNLRCVCTLLTLEKNAPMTTTHKNLIFLPITCTGYEINKRAEFVVTILIANNNPIMILYFILIGF